MFDLLEFIHPFEFIFLLAPLTAHIFAYMYMHPFMGFQHTCTCIPLWDFWPFRRWQWRSQGLLGWATRPPGGPKWGRKWVKVWGKIRKLNRDLRKKWGKWNSCPPGTVRLATALDEWSLMGFSYCFVVNDAIWDFQFVSQRWTPFEFWGSFAAFRPYTPLLSLYSLLAPLTAHIFAYMYMHPFMCFQHVRVRASPYGIYLFIYLFIYSFIHLFT